MSSPTHLSRIRLGLDDESAQTGINLPREALTSSEFTCRQLTALRQAGRPADAPERAAGQGCEVREQDHHPRPGRRCASRWGQAGLHRRRRGGQHGLVRRHDLHGHLGSCRPTLTRTRRRSTGRSATGTARGARWAISAPTPPAPVSNRTRGFASSSHHSRSRSNWGRSMKPTTCWSGRSRAAGPSSLSTSGTVLPAETRWMRSRAAVALSRRRVRRSETSGAR
jgi:hypothetical protein